MVLIGAATLDAGTVVSVMAPSPQGKDDPEKGKGKGKEGEAPVNGGKAPATPPANELPSAPPRPGLPAAAPSGGQTSASTTTLTTVSPFWIDVRETTAAAYRACVQAGACRAASCGAAGDDHPVACVARSDAATYCQWKGKRLPTGVEWTAAVAGSSARRYPWGDAAPSPERLDACGAECASLAMYAGTDGYPGTAPVGSFPAGSSPEGVMDLAGNVAEWVDEQSSIARGGSFADIDPAAVAARAARELPVGSASPDVGFRCALAGGG